MNGTTKQVGDIYRALKEILANMNRLGQDCRQALREEDLDLESLDEYSYSASALSLKRSHCWWYSKPREEVKKQVPPRLVFFACFVCFEADKGRWKATPAGDPELWFFFGSVIPPPTERWATLAQTFFKDAELSHFVPRPKIGGDVSYYSYDDGEEWRVVCLGQSLDEIDTAEALRAKAVRPLLAEAVKRGINI